MWLIPIIRPLPSTSQSGSLDWIGLALLGVLALIMVGAVVLPGFWRKPSRGTDTATVDATHRSAA